MPDPAAQGAEERFTIYEPSPGDKLAECRECGFAFDASQIPGGFDSCPNCRLEAVEGVLRRLARAGEHLWADLRAELDPLNPALNPTEQRGSDG